MSGRSVVVVMKPALSASWPGLSRHPRLACATLKDVDARHKAGMTNSRCDASALHPHGLRQYLSQTPLTICRWACAAVRPRSRYSWGI